LRAPKSGQAQDLPLHNRIRDLAEQLDAHRKRQQALHPDLTLTGMYNVLEKLREFDDSLPFKTLCLKGMGEKILASLASRSVFLSCRGKNT